MTAIDSPNLVGARVVARLGTPDDVPAILEFHATNRAHLAPWEPIPPPNFATTGYWRERLALDAEEFANDRSMRLHLFRRHDGVLIGNSNYSSIVLGAWHCCNLGYKIGQAWEGQGLMREALELGIAHAFGPLNLHRIQANYMPHNTRSAALLERLGFVQEGLARGYLRIAGAWQDHVLTSLNNPAWREPG
jgi:ribosomal-protein-alanine N-acetyltransferase